ncbi:MAG: HlyD family efflux transporter periplasmic adaptor subunit [Limnospira sp. PMC 1291.21]|uniref:HlyD family efflux transporter periplasmic adaptor subunit n=1 Tax=unclassified Limnospira TaxID=2642885 RepID=UPI0028E17FEB|nr:MULTISPECIES: HlyD family efflux transporter periplasmic adaptor subunit [unclassified Limnospira]MDT9178932.1 HlyD family efflux transporter periplasmic adaptor subunit [Limnospira sp. PMC 1238.20]MDT9194152.1 HlyD family efflux transporter periplasmic adaptor subunit [Limnospira sp. PMC 1245.20]MDT9204396.1 HlyD family efflux transporter periplasmic adaptor subunit [Limnospira sp. PMC 1243.20]MDT9224991.1 HlyD family efflux transporter periplasmic adaptor subunit [Limnospira sp. PMC 1279.2
MPQFNDIAQTQLNGHKSLDTDLVSLQPESSLLTDQNLPANNLNSSADWSFATKELLDALPQRWTRGLLYFLIVFVAIALPWGMLSQVDETGSGRGRLEPQGGTVKQKLNLTYTSAALNSQTAKVEMLNIEEGDMVKAGDILMELDSLPIRERIMQLQLQQQSKENRLNTLEQQKNRLETELLTQERQNQSQQLEKLSQVEQARRNLQSLKTTYNLQEQEKLTQVDQAEQNLAALRRILNLQREEKLAQIRQAKRQLQDSETAYILAEMRWQKAIREVERYDNLLDDGVVTEVRLIEQEDIKEERQRIWEQSKADIEQARLRLEEQESSYERIIHQAEADIEQAELRLAEQKRSYDRTIHQAQADIQQAELRLAEQESSSETILHSGEIAVSKIEDQLKNLQTQIISLQAEIAQDKKDIESLNFELEKRVVRAQEGGTIFSLPISGVGDVVQQGGMLVEIAPQEAMLLLKAEMATTESGSLQEGMAVKMKFDAYPFQDYGVVEGSLIKISPTTKMQETSQGKVAIYELEIELEQTCIPSGNDCIPLRPGDTATAEVVVRRRRIIDFILDPFKRLQQGGLEL